MKRTRGKPGSVRCKKEIVTDKKIVVVTNEFTPEPFF
jgi:hypothetical protein